MRPLPPQEPGWGRRMYNAGTLRMYIGRFAGRRSLTDSRGGGLNPTLAHPMERDP